MGRMAAAWARAFSRSVAGSGAVVTSRRQPGCGKPGLAKARVGGQRRLVIVHGDGWRRLLQARSVRPQSSGIAGGRRGTAAQAQRQRGGHRNHVRARDGYGFHDPAGGYILHHGIRPHAPGCGGVLAIDDAPGSRGQCGGAFGGDAGSRNRARAQGGGIAAKYGGGYGIEARGARQHGAHSFGEGASHPVLPGVRTEVLEPQDRNSRRGARLPTRASRGRQQGQQRHCDQPAATPAPTTIHAAPA